MSKIEQVCNRHDVKKPEQIIFEIEEFSIDFNESDLLDSLSKINSYEDRIIYLEDLAERTKPNWESGVKSQEITDLHDLLKKYLLDYRKSLHEENKRQILQSRENSNKQKTKGVNRSESTQIGRPEDFPKKKTLQWYNELKDIESYQHKNGKPHKTEIKREIIRRHSELRKDRDEPSMDTINTQFRKLGLTR